MGYDNAKGKRTLGNGQAGGKVALPIFEIDHEDGVGAGHRRRRHCRGRRPRRRAIWSRCRSTCTPDSGSTGAARPASMSAALEWRRWPHQRRVHGVFPDSTTAAASTTPRNACQPRAASAGSAATAVHSRSSSRGSARPQPIGFAGLRLARQSRGPIGNGAGSRHPALAVRPRSTTAPPVRRRQLAGDRQGF